MIELVDHYLARQFVTVLFYILINHLASSVYTWKACS